MPWMSTTGGPGPRLQVAHPVAVQRQFVLAGFRHVRQRTPRPGGRYASVTVVTLCGDGRRPVSRRPRADRAARLDARNDARCATSTCATTGCPRCRTGSASCPRWSRSRSAGTRCPASRRRSPRSRGCAGSTSTSSGSKPVPEALGDLARAARPRPRPQPARGAAGEPRPPDARSRSSISRTTASASCRSRCARCARLRYLGATDNGLTGAAGLDRRARPPASSCGSTATR